MGLAKQAVFGPSRRQPVAVRVVSSVDHVLDEAGRPVKVEKVERHFLHLTKGWKKERGSTRRKVTPMKWSVWRRAGDRVVGVVTQRIPRQ